MILTVNRLALIGRAKEIPLGDLELSDLADKYYHSAQGCSFVAVTDGKLYKVLKYRNGPHSIDPIDREEFDDLLLTALGEQ